MLSLLSCPPETPEAAGTGGGRGTSADRADGHARERKDRVRRREAGPDAGNSFPDRARLPFHASRWAMRCWRTGARRITYGWRRAIVSGRRRNGTPRTVTARVMSILSAFSKEHPILGLPEISRRTGLSSSTAHRLAAELTDWGALARTSDLRYRIGPTLHRLSEISPGYRQPANLHCESRTGKSGVVDND